MKKHPKGRISANVALACALVGIAGSAWGFPTWMGVYGSYQTHDGANPGTYSILMNQDYWGLHAEVGIGVGGTWTTHAMEYIGNADGNSLWRYHPGEAVTEGATVQYYFHGWDDWGGNIYANNGGTNYSFVAGPAEIDWIGDSEQTPAAPVAGEDIRLWTQTWPRGAGQSGFALFSVLGAWSGIPLAKAGTTNGNDLWRGTLGRFPAGTAVEWVAAVEDGAGTTHYDNNLGSNYAFTVAAGSPLAFFGNAYHWPADGALTSADDLWLNVFASPSQTLVEAHSDYAVNGWLWERTPLSFRQLDGTNEWWHVDLGTMPPASTVFYAFDALDGAGNTLAFPASGIPRPAHVAGSPADADADGLPDDWEAYWFSDASATTAHANPDGDGLPGMPFDNWMERVVGTDPAVSNEVAELPLLWKPSLPQQGGVVLLSAAPEALAGLALPAITATFADGTTATLALDASGRWSGTAWVSRTNTACTIVSFSGGGETDGNRGLGWTLPVKVLPEGEEADSDGDGMPDSWEAANALDPLADDASGDPDSDGISNLDEYLAGLDPQAPEADLWWDFDGDGVPTLVERQRHTDPADPDDVPEADLLLSPDPADWAARIAAAVATNPAPYTIVQLAGGTYATNSGIVLSLASSNLVLVGSADPGNPTVLDGQLLGRCLSVTGDNVSLAFLRFANGVGYTYYPGGAIYAGGVRNLLLSHCRIENCFSDAQHAPSAVPTRSIPVPWGAALYMGGVGGSAAFANTLVCGCGEGALFAAPEGSAALRLANCTLVDNDTGPAFTGFSPLSVENAIIWHCGEVAGNLPADTAIANICLESEPSCTNTTGVTTNPPGLVHGWRVDGTESANVLAYAASPLACDIEGDVRPALSALGADEWRDTDEDGIPDWWEILYGFDPEDPDDADSDPDGDGLDNADEYLHETPPRVADADGDGWTDGEEAAAGTDPRDRLDAPRLARGVLLHAVKYAADGSNQWVQLHCSGPRAVDVGGFRLQAAGTNWETQVALPEGTWMVPGHFLLVGGEGVTNADVTADLALAGTYSNLPTAGVRLLPPEGATNGPVDVLVYAQNLCFNENGLDTTGWLSQTTNLWASSTRHLERWNLGVDTDRENDWRHALDGEEPANSEIVLDTDGDGLTDEQEYTGSRTGGVQTNPFAWDSDGDGLWDGFEVRNDLNPNVADSDGNGTDDAGEINTATGNTYGQDQTGEGVDVSWTVSSPGWVMGASLGSNGWVEFELTTPDGGAIWASVAEGGHTAEAFTHSVSGATILYEKWNSLGGFPRLNLLLLPNQDRNSCFLKIQDDSTGSGVTDPDRVGADISAAFQAAKLDISMPDTDETTEESPGEFIADAIVHAGIPRTPMTILPCPLNGFPGKLRLTWGGAHVNVYASGSGGVSLAEYTASASGFPGATLYVEGISPGTTGIEWKSEIADSLTDAIVVTIVAVTCDTFDRIVPRKQKTIGITIQPSPLAGGLKLDITRNYGTSGNAVLTSPTNGIIHQSGDIYIQGGEQSWDFATIAAPRNLTLNIKLNSNNKYLMKCPFTVCAHPVGFRQLHKAIRPEVNALYFVYGWESDSENLRDLDKVWVGEAVTYSDKGQHAGEGRPWAQNDNNPTILPAVSDMMGTIGAANDYHYPPGRMLPTAGPVDFYLAIQYYGFRCQRCRQGCGILPADMETLLGAIVILRQVEFDGTNWIYRIEKSGTEYTKKLQ